MINQLDTQAFLWLNSFHSDFLDPIMLWITGRNSWFPVYGILIGTIVWSQKRKSIEILLMIIFSVIISDQVCSSILKPLIQETANKILSLSPSEAQTGPANRKDTQTKNAHLNFLTNQNQKEIYKILTKSIIDNGKKL